MPLNDWQGVPLVTTGDMWTAANHNTYIRQNQQALYDGLTGGSGAGSDVDAVDGRHASAGEKQNLAWVDVRTINIADGYAGWLPIAYGDGRRSGVIGIAEGWNGRHNVWVGEVHARYGKGFIRELVSHRYNILTIHAIRVIIDGDNAIYGKHTVEVYVTNDSGSVATLYVYQRHDFAGINNALPWTLRYCPDEVPSNVKVLTSQGVANGSWKLERALTGSSAPVGYMAPADKQATFTFHQSDWWTDANDDGLLDGDTGTRAGDKLETDDQVVYIIYKADEPITLDKIKSSFVYTAQGSDVTMAVEASDDASNWTGLGYVAVQDNSPTAELTFSATRALYWKVKFHVYAGGSGWSVGVAEIDFSVAATLIVTGVPLGCTLKAFDANGAVLEEVRNEVWHKAAPVMFTVPATQISSITVTRPSNTNRWLHFEPYLGTAEPFQNGDVYVLYPEA